MYISKDSIVVKFRNRYKKPYDLEDFKRQNPFTDEILGFVCVVKDLASLEGVLISDDLLIKNINISKIEEDKVDFYDVAERGFVRDVFGGLLKYTEEWQQVINQDTINKIAGRTVVLKNVTIIYHIQLNKEYRGNDLFNTIFESIKQNNPQSEAFMIMPDNEELSDHYKKAGFVGIPKNEESGYVYKNLIYFT